jgi:hypothetical protein
VSAVSDTLAEARRLIVERGWWHHDGDEVWARALCISTAIQLACNQGIIGRFEYGRFGEAMQAVRNVVGVSAVAFNDAPGRTLEEVLDALDRAIAASS